MKFMTGATKCVFSETNPKTTNTVACGFERQRVRWPLHSTHNFRLPVKPGWRFLYTLEGLNSSAENQAFNVNLTTILWNYCWPPRGISVASSATTEWFVSWSRQLRAMWMVQVILTLPFHGRGSWLSCKVKLRTRLNNRVNRFWLQETFQIDMCMYIRIN